ncbi:TPA: hypothetical protein U1B46_000849 [Streptococcus suis]|nr:hypothetical protein [Streptococcus suis]HEM4819146.1 hypothetical protein [Streptococcus suis]HEM6204344.1 hypothetical protein [Streptococcus suis]HEM6370885.1 hypothetical protein [Streptococcus suis]
MAKRNKKTNVSKKAKTQKQTEIIVNPDAYKQQKPRWSFELADLDHSKWSILNNDFVEKELFRKLKDFEGMTWQAIDSSSGGRTHGTNSHFIKIEDLIKEARDRAAELNLTIYESLYSLRLQSKIRLFGVLKEGVFHIVWYDCEHAICPSKKN